MSKLLCAAFAIATPAVFLLACATERVVDPKQRPSFGPMAPTACDWPGSEHGSEREEEILGDIISSSSDWTAFLTRGDDDDSRNNQVSYLDTNGVVNFLHPCDAGGHFNLVAEWGWYGLGSVFGPQCHLSANQQLNQYDRHRLPNGPWITEERERHCVKAGHFTLTLKQDDAVAFVRPIDFIGYTSTQGFDIESNTTSGYASQDVRVNVKEVSGGTVPNAVIDVSATLDRNDPSWTSLPPGVIHMPSNFYARFRASNSSSPNGIPPVNELLVRYFWNSTVDPSDRTGFTNPVSGKTLVRVNQFGQGTRTVLAHVIDTDDRPSPPDDVVATNYGATATLTFDVYGPLTATISPSSPTVMVLNALQFTGGGSTGAPPDTYVWNFGDGISSPDFNPSHVYETPGSKTVTFKRIDSYGFEYTANTDVTVTDPPPTGLSASSITGTTATIGWTTGNNLAPTTIERRPTGTGTWQTGGTVGPGVSSLGLSSLSPCTPYDVRGYHVQPGAPTVALNLFRTSSAGIACAPSSFTLIACTVDAGSVFYNVGWTRGEFSVGSTWQIGKSSTISPAGATVIASGPSHKTGTVLGGYATNKSVLLYFWVRHTLSGGAGPSAWAPLDYQPLNPSNGCLQ